MTEKKLVEFIKPKSMGTRDWWEEILIALSPGNYSLKKLFIKAGKKWGLQYHHFKDESAYVVYGKMIIRHDNGNGKLVETIVSEGDSFRFPPSAVHQEEAISVFESNSLPVLISACPPLKGSSHNHVAYFPYY